MEVVKELLKAPGEAVNISDEVFFRSHSSFYFTTVFPLIFNIDVKREESPLLVAVKLGRVDIVTALLDAGAEIHKCDAVRTVCIKEHQTTK